MPHDVYHMRVKSLPLILGISRFPSPRSVPSFLSHAKPHSCIASDLIMQLTSILAALSAAGVASAYPWPTATDVNPFLGKNYFANSNYARELNTTIAAFLAKNDTLNAAR